MWTVMALIPPPTDAPPAGLGFARLISRAHATEDLAAAYYRTLVAAGCTLVELTDPAAGVVRRHSVD